MTNNLQEEPAVSAPCFVVAPTGGFWLNKSGALEQKSFVLGAISSFYRKLTIFDADGHKWKSNGVRTDFRRTWWRVLLAHTVYNPSVTIKIRVCDPKPYELKELKAAYVRAVRLDHGILTQYVDAPELKDRIDAAGSFDELVAVYEWMRLDSLQ